MKLDEKELKQVQQELEENTKGVSKSETFYIRQFLKIVEKNLSEDYKFLGSDCYKKEGLYRFQAWIDAENKEIAWDIIDYLNRRYRDHKNELSITYGPTMRVVLTVAINIE